MSSIEGFKGEWSFLSNFYPCEIQYDGLTLVIIGPWGEKTV